MSSRATETSLQVLPLKIANKIVTFQLLSTAQASMHCTDEAVTFTSADRIWIVSLPQTMDLREHRQSKYHAIWKEHLGAQSRST